MPGPATPPIRSLALFLLAALSFAATAGCQPAPGSGAELPEDVRTSVDKEKSERLPLKPEWKRFAEVESRGLVLAKLNSPFYASFPEPPMVVATRYPARKVTELLIASEVEVPNVTNALVRRPYYVIWRMGAGGRWEVYDIAVEGEKPLPTPPSTRPRTGR